jgi:glycosyltransferase involved in cell wall biosynthesis
VKTSLVMATYNGMEYLREQLDSVVDQSLPVDEVIIRDDCSTDGTPLFIQNYIRDNHLENWRIELNESNLGYKKTFTRLLHEASNEIIFLADQDDVWEHEKVKIMLGVMEENASVLLLASDFSLLYMYKNAPRVYFEKIDKPLKKYGFCAKWIKPVRPGCCFAIRRELLLDYDKFWTADMPHDCALWNVASLRNASYCIDSKLIRYRRHEQNASNLGAHDIEYRAKCIEQEIGLIDRSLSMVTSVPERNFLEKQKQVYKSRVSALRTGRLLQTIMLGFQKQYYGMSRYALTDIYYCLKRKLL